jgi:alkaline phosphatase
MTVNDSVEYLLGLFEGDHCMYNLKTNPKTEPTLREMTEKAIQVLSKNDKGYFLFVEGTYLSFHTLKVK